jgi:hypothetical protein
VFVRKVKTLLKPNGISWFNFLMEQEVIPMLYNEKGFLDGMSIFAHGEGAVTTISLWDNASSAEAYSRGTFVDVRRKLAELIEGVPKVDNYELLNSTWAWFHAGQGIEQRSPWRAWPRPEIQAPA